MLGVAVGALAPALLTIDQPITLRRRGVETMIVAGAFEPLPDPVLIRALADARAWAIPDGRLRGEVMTSLLLGTIPWDWESQRRLMAMAM